MPRFPGGSDGSPSGDGRTPPTGVGAHTGPASSAYISSSSGRRRGGKSRFPAAWSRSTPQEKRSVLRRSPRGPSAFRSKNSLCGGWNQLVLVLRSDFYRNKMVDDLNRIPVRFSQDFPFRPSDCIHYGAEHRNRKFEHRPNRGEKECSGVSGPHRSRAPTENQFRQHQAIRLDLPRFRHPAEQIQRHRRQLRKIDRHRGPRRIQIFGNPFKLPVNQRNLLRHAHTHRMQSGIHLKGMLGIHADQCGAALAKRFVKRPDQERLIRMGTAGKEDALSFRIFTSEGAHAVEESLPAESRLPAFRLPPLQT